MYTIVGITPGSIVEFSDAKGVHEALVKAIIGDTTALLFLDKGRATLRDLRKCKLKKIESMGKVYDLNGGLLYEK